METYQKKITLPQRLSVNTDGFASACVINQILHIGFRICIVPVWQLYEHQ